MTKLDTLIASLPDAPFRRQLTDEIESLRHDNTSLLHLLALIREACGDNGKRMQDELVTYIRDEWQGHISHIALLKAALKAERAEADEMREALQMMVHMVEQMAPHLQGKAYDHARAALSS